jgi:hypothetical protein
MENLILQSGSGTDFSRSRRPGEECHRQWVRMEHYRLHCAEGWPDSPHKEAVLAAARSALQRLEMAILESFDSPACSLCATRRTRARQVLIFPSKAKVAPPLNLKPAA